MYRGKKPVRKTNQKEWTPRAVTTGQLWKLGHVARQDSSCGHFMPSKSYLEARGVLVSPSNSKFKVILFTSKARKSVE